MAHARRGLNPTTEPHSRTESWLSEFTGKERKQTKFHPGLCCWLHRRHQRSLTELLVPLSGSSPLEWDKTHGEAEPSKQHAPERQPGRQETLCLQEKTPCPSSWTWLGSSTSPSSCYPTEQEPGVLRPTHGHALQADFPLKTEHKDNQAGKLPARKSH